MHLSLPKIRRAVKREPVPAQPHYDLAAHQMATAIGISLEDAQGWVDMARRRANGVRE